MKRVFRMKAMLLSALLCAIGFGTKAQIADASNSTLCSVMVRFYAVDVATCTVVATDAGPYFIPALTPPPMFIPAAWVPGFPAAPYFIVAEVADAACGFPGVFVGPPIAPCGYVPTAPLPPCPGCKAALVDNPGPIFPPGGGGAGMHYPLNVHP